MGYDNDPIVKMLAKTSDIAVRKTRDASPSFSIASHFPLTSMTKAIQAQRLTGAKVATHRGSLCWLPTADLDSSAGKFKLSILREDTPTKKEEDVASGSN